MSFSQFSPEHEATPRIHRLPQLPKLTLNADAAAIAIALLLAALVRLNVLPHIGW